MLYEVITGIVVVQEISPQILPSFAEQFNKSVPWEIHALQEDTIIEPGACYIGSTETSLSFTQSANGKPLVLVGEAVDRPIDLLYSSAAEAFHGPVVGVLLGGIGRITSYNVCYTKLLRDNHLETRLSRQRPGPVFLQHRKDHPDRA